MPFTYSGRYAAPELKLLFAVLAICGYKIEIAVPTQTWSIVHAFCGRLRKNKIGLDWSIDSEAADIPYPHKTTHYECL